MRKDNVIALLDHAANDLSGSELKNIEQQYREALSKKEIPTSLQIDVKNCMENLRSALDYMAHDIYEKLIRPLLGPKDNIHFPYGETENDFKSGLGSNLPKLHSLNHKLFELIEHVQTHKCNNDWLYQLCRIVNENKHDRLTPQTRTERKTMKASVEGGSVTVPIDDPNVSIKQSDNGQVTLGGIPVKFNNQGIEPLAPGIKRTVTTWISFCFDKTNIQVLPLLEKALAEITTLTDAIYKELK